MKTGNIEKEKLVDITQFKAPSCIRPRSIKIEEHFLENLPCIHDANKLIADERGNQIFNAESFNVYQRNKGSGRKSSCQMPLMHCCLHQEFWSIEVRGKRLQKVIAGQCEVIGCTEVCWLLPANTTSIIDLPHGIPPERNPQLEGLPVMLICAKPPPLVIKLVLYSQLQWTKRRSSLWGLQVHLVTIYEGFCVGSNIQNVMSAPEPKLKKLSAFFTRIKTPLSSTFDS